MSDAVITDKTDQLSNLQLRVLTAMVFLPIALIATLVGGWLFLAVLLPVTAIGLLEFYILEKGTRIQGSSLTGIPTAILIIVAFYFNLDWLWQLALIACVTLTFFIETIRHPHDIHQSLVQVATTLIGILYVAFPGAFLVKIRALQPDGLTWLLVIFAVTWGTDTFAYFSGRFFGKHKLAPKISPKKTIEGAIGGVIGAWIPAFLILILTGVFQPILIPMILIGPFVAIAGDLFESALKRSFDVKDSFVQGFNIFPGHGGVLDRVDALLWVSVWVFIYLLFIGII